MAAGAKPKKGCPYVLLGVERAATPGELRKSYHKLARACHPDKNREPGAVESFQVRWRD